MRHILTIILFLALFSGCIEAPPESTDWNINIDYFATTLEKQHKNLFFQLTRDNFYDQVESLKQQTENLSDAEVVIELSKILTNVGDAHTTVDLGNACFNRLPFGFLYLNDGLFCYRTPENCSKLLGKVLSGIDDTRMEDLYTRYQTIIPHENEPKLQLGIQSNLFCSEILEYLEIAENGHQFTVYTSTGLSIPISETELSSISLSFFSGKNVPLYIQDTNKEYWMKALPDEKIMYVQYNSCSQMEGYSFGRFTSDVMKAIKDQNLEKMVVDLRWNGGGNSLIFGPMLNAIKAHSTINQDGHLYVIIGKY
nr:S41 family peptidase [Prolixibacteraceae bacterium]